MSRICVKNLPMYVKEDRLREFFSQKGEVTDAKLMRTTDGKSRQFGFVGFRTEREADEALKFFDNTYMDTSRITCEIARRVGDPNTPRPWSRYSVMKNNLLKENSKESSKNSSLTTSKGQRSSSACVKNLGSSENSDSKLREFMQIMQPRSKAKLWTNDTIHSMDFSEQKSPEKETQQGKIKKSSLLQAQLFDESDLADKSSPRSLIKGSKKSPTDKSPQVAKDDVISDMDYLKSRIKKNWSDSEADGSFDEDGDHGSGNGHNDDNSHMDVKDQIVKYEDSHEHAINAQLAEENIDEENCDVDNMDRENPMATYNDDRSLALETGRLFVRNLPYTTNEDELRDLFSQFGDVSEVHLVADKNTKRSKGIGYLLYTLPESATRALEALDNSIFQGRLLHVMAAKPQNRANGKLGSETTTANDKKNLKQQREEQKKASEASGDTRAWNSLFMRQDTVVENIVRKHGISRNDFLEREADDLAVRIALGETQVVTETKKALSNAGVNVASLEEFASKKNSNTRRSNHVILVKNLPYGSTEGELANMFVKFGTLDKIILPPTKTLAVVIFLEAAEARAAFKGLAYKRYKDVPLYLEWAPDDVLCPRPGIEENEPKDAVSEQNSRNVMLKQAVGVLEEEIDPDRVESRSIFVKNLNFNTSDESLKDHFLKIVKCGSIKSVKVKKHVKNGKNLSMGFGFIEFDTVETATNVCRDALGTILDGHALILQLCHVKTDPQALKKEGKDKSLTKLIVRNVAFEATEKDLRQLLSPFGQIKSLRLPMKLGSHRGFAFVEYFTKQEAQNALQALSSTHLYGRHLVLERAKEGESLEELRARTAAQFIDEHSGFQKLSRKRKNLNILDEGNVKFSKLLD
ncbi:multiple RNA-binding domain-containing protein 1 [Dendrobium catenatum]|uniref:multiple RNA-binding domain-containing protein 1 n=1 Tax=Dendrobium catenatum TaxID=906689 RepID=UPI0009F6731A|nr:multiple RNA-binding domain-containing protein 1 [Dendrobium catenatum]